MTQASYENVEKLRGMVFSDPSLKSRVEAAGDEAGMVAALIAIGSERNIPISQEDVAAWRAAEVERHQLSEEQLADVAGGTSLKPPPTGVNGGLTPPSLGPKPGQVNPVRAGRSGVAYVSYGDSILCGFCGNSGTSK
jgi:hypothetical protein